MAPVYDTVSTGMANGTIGYYASDKINIEYSYTGTGTAPEVGFYLAEQETKHTTYTMQYAKLNSDNVDISIKNNYGTTTKNLYNYDNSLNNFKVYTNVQKRSGATSTVNVQNLTYSEMSISPLCTSEEVFFTVNCVTYTSSLYKVKVILPERLIKFLSWMSFNAISWNFFITSWLILNLYIPFSTPTGRRRLMSIAV